MSVFMSTSTNLCVCACIRAHLIFLAGTLLDMLRRRLLRYSVVGRLLSFEETVDWVRRKAMHLFMHRVKEANGAFRNILNDDKHEVT
jgi:hypothetical protein